MVVVGRLSFKMQKLKLTVLVPWTRLAEIMVEKIEVTSKTTPKMKIPDGHPYHQHHNQHEGWCDVMMIYHHHITLHYIIIIIIWTWWDVFPGKILWSNRSINTQSWVFVQIQIQKVIPGQSTPGNSHHHHHWYCHSVGPYQLYHQLRIAMLLHITTHHLKK